MDLIVVVVGLALTIGYFMWQRPDRSGHPMHRLALTGLWCVTLLLALRFGARTYPGVYYSGSGFLNWLFNGQTIFTDIGYELALLAGMAEILLILSDASMPRFQKWMRIVKWVSLGLAVAIALYGFYWALVLDRMPWSPPAE